MTDIVPPTIGGKTTNALSTALPIARDTQTSAITCVTLAAAGLRLPVITAALSTTPTRVQSTTTMAPAGKGLPQRHAVYIQRQVEAGRTMLATKDVWMGTVAQAGDRPTTETHDAPASQIEPIMAATGVVIEAQTDLAAL